jgi:hypothetical protein
MDDFDARLAAAFAAMLAHRTDPAAVAEAFESVLAEVRETRDPARTHRVREAAFAAFDELYLARRPVCLEVRYLCWHLQHLNRGGYYGTSTDFELLLVTRSRFAWYRGHTPERCAICFEFPDDEWVNRPRTGERKP